MQAAWAVEYLLLGLLAERPMHGYELARLVRTDANLSLIWHLKRSEVYFLLGKLLAQGCIREAAPSPAAPSPGTPAGPGPEPAEQPESRPPRTLYAVTPAGRETLDRWLVTPETSPRGLRASFLAKLYVAARRDPARAIELVQSQRRVLEQWVGRLQPAAASGSFAGLAVRLRTAQAEAALGTLDEICAWAGNPDFAPSGPVRSNE